MALARNPHLADAPAWTTQIRRKITGIAGSTPLRRTDSESFQECAVIMVKPSKSGWETPNKLKVHIMEIKNLYYGLGVYYRWAKYLGRYFGYVVVSVGTIALHSPTSLNTQQHSPL